MSVLSGQGRHFKKKANQWESDSESEENLQVSVPDDGSPNGTSEPEPVAEELNNTDFNELRNISRNKYLEQRQQSKIIELGQEIREIEAKVESYGINSLSKYEQNELTRKRKIYSLVNEREKLKSDVESVEYQLPESGMEKKRKLEILHKKSDVEKDDKPIRRGKGPGDPVLPKRNKFENQWEEEQFKRAQVVVTKNGPDEIDLPDQNKYEYVFDESQFVQFNVDDETVLQGDKNNYAQQQAVTDTVIRTGREKMSAIRQSLPVFQYREKFLDLIEANQILIVVGETGSGKTTQLPQYLNEAGYSKKGTKMIGCTQPRRVAATSVATRVAEEMGVKLGEEVGYNIRFEDVSDPQKTVVKYLTDGMLLREFLTDPELSSYGALMIDEAHERTVSTEIILSLLKDILEIRKDLKLIVASATINAQKFSDFFDGAPIFQIPGRRFPVDIHYTKNPEANYIQAAITTVFQIHTTQPKLEKEEGGDILIFLTGQDEIETMQESLEEAASKLEVKDQLMICPIYANLPPDQQQKIFEPTPPKCRKIVLATNIAETSITIDGVSYVIDPGYVKENVFNPISGMESLVVVPCSKASADQRAGRAGRVGPGKCFRLYTKWSFYNELQANPTPEILRVKLTSIVLLLLSIGVTDLIGFQFMDPPSPETLMKSFELLYALGALNSQGGLTKIGRMMIEFPIDVMFAKALISSTKFGISSEILSIISMLSESSNLFYRPKDKREAADKRKEKFHREEGDHFMLLDIWNEWVDVGYSNQWCQDNFLQYKTLKRVKDVREQLKRQCIRAGISDETTEVSKMSKKNNKIIQIQKALTSGFFPNVARLSKMGDSYRTLKKNQVIYIHPSSSLFSQKPPPKLLLYHELVLTSKEFMRNCMTIDVSWLGELAPHYYNEKELDGTGKVK
ncbi:pre-mRNA-splicing factor ATP-dependent RNA helicase-like protein Prp2p [[Candida] railenensis]|uniref:RNA helicase n=1 Tax=[Candida] railenensis TaxID=45579 RepID=A0A9P0QU26_9ASCO|nr:pre-mRNA-splicing factor ATP-dependent RNA helicase-like protein Prp2p [[Candida] railenensis]